MARRRIVLDTNAIVSRLLAPRSAPARAVDHALARDYILASESTLAELANVLGRSKFDPYLALGERQEFLRVFNRVAKSIECVSVIKACRDQKDNKFLELAIDGAADLIVTGDRDLLALHPFLGVAILTPAQFLRE